VYATPLLQHQAPAGGGRYIQQGVFDAVAGGGSGDLGGVLRASQAGTETAGGHLDGRCQRTDDG